MPYESRCRPTSPPTTAAPQFSVPVDVASHTGAMQAQEHRIQRWAVATRTRNPSQEALMSCFHNELHELDELSPLEKVLNHGLHGLHEFFILHLALRAIILHVRGQEFV